MQGGEAEKQHEQRRKRKTTEARRRGQQKAEGMSIDMRARASTKEIEQGMENRQRSHLSNWMIK